MQYTYIGWEFCPIEKIFSLELCPSICNLYFDRLSWIQQGHTRRSLRLLLNMLILIDCLCEIRLPLNLWTPINIVRLGFSNNYILTFQSMLKQHVKIKQPSKSNMFIDLHAKRFIGLSTYTKQHQHISIKFSIWRRNLENGESIYATIQEKNNH